MAKHLENAFKSISLYLLKTIFLKNAFLIVFLLKEFCKKHWNSHTQIFIGLEIKACSFLELKTI